MTARLRVVVLVFCLAVQFANTFDDLCETRTVNNALPCGNYNLCGSCTRNSKCGWCSSTQKCTYGNQTCPYLNDCPSCDWEFGSCGARDACSLYSSCRACSADPACGWCTDGDVSTCTDGSKQGPNSGSCPADKWFHETCPFGCLPPRESIPERLTIPPGTSKVHNRVVPAVVSKDPDRGFAKIKSDDSNLADIYNLAPKIEASAMTVPFATPALPRVQELGELLGSIRELCTGPNCLKDDLMNDNMPLTDNAKYQQGLWKDEVQEMRIGCTNSDPIPGATVIKCPTPVPVPLPPPRVRTIPKPQVEVKAPIKVVAPAITPARVVPKLNKTIVVPVSEPSIEELENITEVDTMDDMPAPPPPPDPEEIPLPIPASSSLQEPQPIPVAARCSRMVELDVYEGGKHDMPNYRRAVPKEIPDILAPTSTPIVQPLPSKRAPLYAPTNTTPAAQESPIAPASPVISLPKEKGRGQNSTSILNATLELNSTQPPPPVQTDESNTIPSINSKRKRVPFKRWYDMKTIEPQAARSFEEPETAPQPEPEPFFSHKTFDPVEVPFTNMPEPESPLIIKTSLEYHQKREQLMVDIATKCLLAEKSKRDNPTELAFDPLDSVPTPTRVVLPQGLGEFDPKPTNIPSTISFKDPPTTVSFAAAVQQGWPSLGSLYPCMCQSGFKEFCLPDAVGPATMPDSIRLATMPDAVRLATMPDVVRPATIAKLTTQLESYIKALLEANQPLPLSDRILAAKTAQARRVAKTKQELQNLTATLNRQIEEFEPPNMSHSLGTPPPFQISIAPNLESRPTPTPDGFRFTLPSLPEFKPLDNCTDRSKVASISPENGDREPLTAYELQVDQIGIMPEGPDGDQITRTSKGTLENSKANMVGTIDSKIPMPRQVSPIAESSNLLSQRLPAKVYQMPQQKNNPSQKSSSFDSWTAFVDPIAIAAEPTNQLDPAVNATGIGCTKCEKRCSTTSGQKVEGCLTLPRRVVPIPREVTGKDPQVVIQSISAADKPKSTAEPPLAKGTSVMLSTGYNMVEKTEKNQVSQKPVVMTLGEKMMNQ